MSQNTSSKDPKRLYSIEEAAQALGVSPWTLRAHRKNGSLEIVNAGRRVLVSSATIDRVSREGLPSLGKSGVKRLG
jgi:excisionase family DNA binding protein